MDRMLTLHDGVLSVTLLGSSLYPSQEEHIGCWTSNAIVVINDLVTFENEAFTDSSEESEFSSLAAF